MATSSSTESIYVQRKRQRQANFLAGRARSAHRLDESLETSLVESTAPSSSGSTPSCKRGCPQILCGLRATFDALGLHPAKALQQRVASYPLPKKQKIAHRNITGKFTIQWHRSTVTIFIIEIIEWIIEDKIAEINNSHARMHTCTHTHARTRTHTHAHTHTLKAQNQWLRQNVIDAYGNLLFCRDCIVFLLGCAHHTPPTPVSRQAETESSLLLKWRRRTW